MKNTHWGPVFLFLLLNVALAFGQQFDDDDTPTQYLRGRFVIHRKGGAGNIDADRVWRQDRMVCYERRGWRECMHQKYVAYVQDMDKSSRGSCSNIVGAEPRAWFCKTRSDALFLADATAVEGGFKLAENMTPVAGCQLGYMIVDYTGPRYKRAPQVQCSAASAKPDSGAVK